MLGRLAETERGDAVDALIAELMRATPAGQPVDVVFTKDSDPCFLHIGVLFADRYCRPIAAHTFRSGRARTRFIAQAGGLLGFMKLWDVVETGWLHGPLVLAALLDTLAVPGIAGATGQPS